MRANLRRLAVLVLSAIALAAAAAAQCQLLASGAPQPELSGTPFCSVSWDPDGAGPLPPRLVVGGDTLLAGAQLFGSSLPSDQQVMTWDGTTWLALGAGPGTLYSSIVTDLVSWNGVLIAGGSFAAAGGVQNIAQWDGAAWQPLGNGLPFSIVALALWNGDLVAIGGTSSTGPLVATWNGATWTHLPPPPLLHIPTTAISFEGELCIAGSTSTPGIGVIERWDGSTWDSSVSVQGTVGCFAVRVSLAVGAPETLFAGGVFTGIGGASVANLAKTDGGPTFAWSAVGTGPSNQVFDVEVRNSGLSGYTVVARQGNVSVPVIRYSSSTNTWSPMGTTRVNSITFHAGSWYGVASAPDEPRCQRYDGSNWVPVRGPGIVGEVRAVTRSGDDVVIGGTFATISGVSTNGVARWNGNTFTPLGTGMASGTVDALVTLDNGDIVAGGSFVTAGGTTVNHVARWNGTAWAPMGGGFDAPVHALCKLPNGDVVAGGAFVASSSMTTWFHHVARWNGTAWSPMHTGMNDDVLALVVRDDGTLFAGGRFTIASTFSRYRVAQWTGTQWGQVGAAMNDAVHGLAARPNGDIVAVGEFTQASLQPVDRIARWNGSTWLSMGAGSSTPGVVRAVHALPNGDIVAGRGFHQATGPDGGVSRWNGSTWGGSIFTVTGTTPGDPVQVQVLAQRADGDLIFGGSFHVLGAEMAYGLGAMRTTCMPVATSYGTGCASAAGPLVLTADTLPWVGGTFRTTTTGVAPGSLCIGLIGLTQLAIPLPTLLAEGQPGCSLLTSLDILLLLTNGPGNTATSSFAFTNDPALIGVPFFQQTLPFEFDLGGTLTAVRGSDALSLVMGTL